MNIDKNDCYFMIVFGILYVCFIIMIVKKNKNNIINQSDITNEIIQMMDHLGYYNININREKQIYINDYIQNILYSSNPNTIELSYFKSLNDNDVKVKHENKCGCEDKNCDYNDDSDKEEEIHDENTNYFKQDYINFEDNNINNYTIKELTDIIKETECYKNYEIFLNNKLNRSIVLSKHLNDNTTNDFYNNLQIHEHQKLNSFNKIN